MAKKKTKLEQYKDIATLKGADWKACRVQAFSFASAGAFHFELMRQERNGLLAYLIFDTVEGAAQVVALEQYAATIKEVAEQMGGKEITAMLG